MDGERQLPLQGIRIIDFSWVGAGPFSTKFFADFGADVIKIESRSRPDQLRRAEPLVGNKGLDESGYFAVRNTNKRSIALDMKRPEARELVLRMAQEADVMVNSFSPGVMKKFGLEYSDVTTVNKEIIYLSMPMAGNHGPYRNFLGYGMSIAAIIGLYGNSGKPGKVPVGTGTNFPDHIPNPLHACFALLAALFYKRKTGRGQEIVMSQLESSLAVYPNGVLVAAAAVAGKEVMLENDSVEHGITDVFPCAGDDKWCVVSIDNREKLVKLGGVIQVDALERAKETEIKQHIRNWTDKRSPQDVMYQLQAGGITAGIVQDPVDYLERDPHLKERSFWQILEHPVMGKSLYHGIPARLSTTSTRYQQGAPLLGQHNADLMTLCGLNQNEYQYLIDEGVVQ